MKLAPAAAAGLDDLHPGGGGHAAEETYTIISAPTMTTAIQYSRPNSSDQLAGADHLADQVKATTTSVPVAAKARIGVC